MASLPKLIKEETLPEPVFQTTHSTRVNGYKMPVVDLSRPGTTVPSAKRIQGRVFKASMHKINFIYHLTDNGQLKMIADALRENRHVQKIDLDCRRPEELFINFRYPIIENGLDYFSTSLRRLHGLKSISLKFDRAFFNDRSLYKLAQALKMQSSLQEVILDISNCPRVTAKGRYYLDRALGALPFIKNLRLNFKNTPADTPYEGSKNLVRALRVLTSLQNFQINFYAESQMTDAIFSEVARALSALQSLRGIDILFDGCKELTEDGVKTLDLAFKPLSRLQTFSLRFLGCKMSEKLPHLLPSLSTLTSLQRVRFTLPYCAETSDELAEFSKTLGGLTSLRELDLEFACTYLFPKSLDILAIELAKLPYLQSLRANFGEFDTSGVLDGFVEVLKTIKTIKHLLLFVNYRTFPDDLLQDLTEMTWLESFGLHFHGSHHVEDSTLEVLSQGLKNLKALKTIHFKFIRCYLLTDEGLSKLASSLKEMNFVNAICLDFLSCEEITNKGMLDIFQALESNLNLKNLYVSFAECEKIDDEGIYGVCKVIKTLVSLETIFLNFDRCTEVTGDSLDVLQEECDMLPRASFEPFEGSEDPYDQNEI